MWAKMIENTSSSEEFYADSLNATSNGRAAIQDFMLNPSSKSGQQFFDLWAIASDMDHNSDFESKSIQVGEDFIQYQ
jgi:hypothetical protein